MFWTKKNENISDLIEMLKVLELKVSKNEDKIMLLEIKFRQKIYRNLPKEEDEESETTKYTDGFDKIRELNKKYGVS